MKRVTQILITVISSIPPVLAYAASGEHAALNPPSINSQQKSTAYKDQLNKTTATLEWVFHKTSDGIHPDGLEQQFMWLMNRARSNPTAEGIWLANITDQDVINNINFFNVNLTTLRNEFAALQTKAPAAFDVRLYQAAKAHSDDLIIRNSQDHNSQFTKVDNAGFKFSTIRGNVFAFTKNGIHGHAGWNLDWGPDNGDGSGMQPGRGHRQSIMSIDNDYSSVGIAVVPTSGGLPANGNVGPLVATGNYARALTPNTNHFNRFITGTVWQDNNNNNQYDIGEGIGGVRVEAVNAEYFAITGNSGGYAFPITSIGNYTINYTGTGLNGKTVNKSVVVTNNSVLADVELNSISESPTPSSGTFPFSVIFDLLLEE